ncbi:hypothetical protein D9M72_315650 [compost metagenome]
MQDPGIQARGRGRDPGESVGADGGNHVARVKHATAGGHGKAAFGCAHAGHLHAGADGKAELLGVGLKVIRELVLGGARVPGRREGNAGEGVVLGRSEEGEGIPPGPPDVPDPGCLLQDDEPHPRLGKVISGGKASLPGAEHHHIKLLHVLVHDWLL